MNSCYFLSFTTFLLLIIGLVQSFLQFNIMQANHLTFMILVCIVYSFTETLVIFFFVGTGVSVKEYTRDHQLDHKYHKGSIGIKRRVYPPLMLNILFMSILFILGGAVDTGRMAVWIYQIVFLGCLVHYIRSKVIQHDCFRENTRIILEMSGISKAAL